MTVRINAAGLSYFEEALTQFPVHAATAMSIALNDGAAVGLKALRTEIMSQIEFPPGYLDLPSRLKISQYSNPSRLEARISGRGRGTSLARFVQGGAALFTKGITIQEHPGRISYFPQGFLASLRSGNIGFAIRVRPGEQVHGVQRYKPVILYRNRKTGVPTAYLLYGASVDQVMNDASLKVTPEVASAVAEEFQRQLARLTRVVR